MSFMNNLFLIPSVSKIIKFAKNKTYGGNLFKRFLKFQDKNVMCRKMFFII